MHIRFISLRPRASSATTPSTLMPSLAPSPQRCSRGAHAALVQHSRGAHAVLTRHGSSTGACRHLALLVAFFTSRCNNSRCKQLQRYPLQAVATLATTAAAHLCVVVLFVCSGSPTSPRAPQCASKQASKPTSKQASKQTNGTNERNERNEPPLIAQNTQETKQPNKPTSEQTNKRVKKPGGGRSLSCGYHDGTHSGRRGLASATRTC